MKKTLNLLGVMALCATTSVSIVACETDQILEVSFSEIFGTTGEIRSLTSDNSNYIYAGNATENYQGNVYKSNGIGNFVEMTGTTRRVDYLVTDGNKNIYTETEPNNFYTATSDSIDFRSMSWPSGSISFLTNDIKGEIWAGNSGGGVYWYSNDLSSTRTWEEQTAFSHIGQILSFRINNFGIIYLVNEKGEIYKYWGSKQDSKFKKMLGVKDHTKKLLIDNKNNVYAITYDKIYKSDGNNNFQEFFSTKNLITLADVNDNKIYIITIDNTLYQIQEQENNNTFKPTELKFKTKIQGMINCFTFFNPYHYLQNLLYIGTDKGKIYYTSIS